MGAPVLVPALNLRGKLQGYAVTFLAFRGKIEGSFTTTTTVPWVLEGKSTGHLFTLRLRGKIDRVFYLGFRENIDRTVK